MNKGLKITTWEHICEALNIDPVKSLAFVQHHAPEDQEHHEYDFKLKKLSKALWGKKKPNFKNAAQEKWYPLFWGNNPDKPASFGFSYSYSYYDDTYTFSGARLSFPSESYSDHAGTQFEDWFRKAYVIPEE